MEVLEKFEFDFADEDLFVLKAYAGGKVVHSEYVHEDEQQAYVEEYGIQVAGIKQVNKADLSDIS